MPQASSAGVSPGKQTAFERFKKRREIPTTRTPDQRTMTVGLASKTPGRNRPEIGGKGGVVLQANCKQWIQEGPGSVRNAAEARNTKSQVKAYSLPLGSALRHLKYHLKWLFKSPLRHQFWAIFPQVRDLRGLWITGQGSRLSAICQH